METLNTRDKLELSRKLARISLNGICADLKADTEYGHDKITEVYSGKRELPIDITEKQISDYAKLVVKLEEIAESLDLETLPTIDGSNYYLLDLEKRRWRNHIQKTDRRFSCIYRRQTSI